MRISCTAILILAVIFVNACSEPPPPREVIRPVRYQAVTRVSGEKQRTFSGVSESGKEAQLSFRISGIVKQIHVVLGQRVKQGDVIARVDKSEAVLDYEKAVAAEKNAKVQVETAKSNLGRVRGLFENNTVSLSDYEAAKNKYAAAQSDYAAAGKNTALKKKELGYYTLFSPMDGIVVSRDVNENENVSAGQAIVGVSSEDDLQVTVGVPEKYIARVGKDTAVTVTFSTLPGRVFKGVVTEISYSVGAASTYPVKIDLEQSDAGLRPGMPASVSFAFTGRADEFFFMVPANAVAEAGDGNFVFTLVPGPEDGFGTVHKKSVEVGKLTDRGFQILAGLAEGEFVVTSGINKMAHSKKVKFIK